MASYNRVTLVDAGIFQGFQGGKTMADIVDIAVGAGAFQTLVTAVQVAGLVDALKSPGPFTVFAPNDDAFAKLPPGTVASLVKSPPQLGRILTYHVAAGKYTKADLEKLDYITSLEGSRIRIDCSDGFEVKNATVIAADIEADNGIIHVIDRVILMGGDREVDVKTTIEFCTPEV